MTVLLQVLASVIGIKALETLLKAHPKVASVEVMTFKERLGDPVGVERINENN